MGAEPQRRSFRDIYRQERAKVRAESEAGPASSRYVTWLGIIAVLCLGLTVLAALTTAGDPGKVATSPALIIGVAAGLLWLAVKAVTGGGGDG